MTAFALIVCPMLLVLCLAALFVDVCLLWKHRPRPLLAAPESSSDARAFPTPCETPSQRESSPYREAAPIDHSVVLSGISVDDHPQRAERPKPPPSGYQPFFRFPLVVWKCPKCGKEGSDFQLWACCGHDHHHMSEGAPACLAEGEKHHLHVRCGTCCSVTAYQARGEDFIEVPPRSPS